MTDKTPGQDHLNVHAICYDIGQRYETADGAMEALISAITTEWEKGADVVILPEYIWLTLIPHIFGSLEDDRILAQWFSKTGWPFIQEKILEKSAGKMVVLGTVPWEENGRIYNRSFVIVDGKMGFHDKVALTPWEPEYTAGTRVTLFSFKGLSVCVLTCLDIEMPEISALFKKEGAPDLILVPSMTPNMMGVNRIARCASARAVELCCAVVTCGTTGGFKDLPILKENYGRAALYMPSLVLPLSLEEDEGNSKGDEVQEGPVKGEGTSVSVFDIKTSLLKQMQKQTQDTNPLHISPSIVLTVALPSVEKRENHPVQ